MDSATLRFADYATSGAFQIGLTRGQITTLMQIAGGDYSPYPQTSIYALERKGLTQTVESSGLSAAQVRPTAAGILVAQLCAMAGLTNSTIPELAQHVDNLTDEIAQMRVKMFEMSEDCWSMQARLDAQEIALTALRAEKEGGGFPKPMVRLRDRQPDKPVEAMAFTSYPRQGAPE